MIPSNKAKTRSVGLDHKKPKISKVSNMGANGSDDHIPLTSKVEENHSIDLSPNHHSNPNSLRNQVVGSKSSVMAASK